MLVSQGRGLLFGEEISRRPYRPPLSFSTSQGFSLKEWVSFCHSFSKLANFKEARTFAQRYQPWLSFHTHDEEQGSCNQTNQSLNPGFITYEWRPQGNDFSSVIHFHYLPQEITRRVAVRLKQPTLTVPGAATDAIPCAECVQGMTAVTAGRGRSRSPRAAWGFGTISRRPGIVHHQVH